jgi:hypothetical protein
MLNVTSSLLPRRFADPVNAIWHSGAGMKGEMKPDFFRFLPSSHQTNRSSSIDPSQRNYRQLQRALFS